MSRHPAASPGLLLWRATLRWQRDIAAALAPLDLTHVQFVLLASTWWLDGQGEVPNQLSLARFAGVDIKMASQVLAGLERKGLVERAPDPSDLRAKHVRITAAGRAAAPEAVAAVEAVDAAFFRPVSERDAIALLSALADEG
ncbi:MarR family winged helix-turn-helix transcriptional regulator [Actinokineospora enzanensis]|uniref:MarR family winged helix-turn-helix transcriptional regulator n=1 Tax=Actinokineospora enzanensis TaxID=155975 RepID=UPI00036BD505|nr:MarR family transcriptional regulator [Actinokineospora enzanensis]